MKANQIALAVCMVSATSATLAHYAEFWIAGYGVSIIAALIVASIFSGEGK